MEEPRSASDGQVMVNDDDESESEGEEVPKLILQASYEAKIRELLHNINSIEIKICSDATKEFIKLLRGETGEELLHVYVQTSSTFTELLQAWKLQQGKVGISCIFSLISVILSHPDGIHKQNDRERIGVSRAIDKFARLLVEEKLDDIYKELNSKEGKRQKSALLLLASIVKRGSGLAFEVAKKFDFKIPGFSKLAEFKRKQADRKGKHSTRKAFVRFAMSFLEVGKPGLLRWVLQQKEMYSGVLRGLHNDDDETVIHVLSTLRDKVLTEESLVPPGLRSVLFGSVTLEQLAWISSREDGGPAGELAHNLLVMVCTDPSNGLMPDSKRHPNPLRGNPNRLLGLMKKLKATEIGCHRDLLLAILRGNPSLGSAYMDEFPYNLDDYASPTWFSTVSLAANLVSSVGMGCPFDFLGSQFHDVSSFHSIDVQNIMKCICPRPFNRSVINKGLLHSDFLVKHGTLRLLLESLKLLDSFTTALNCQSSSSNKMMHSWESLKQEIQNEARILLPDFQVLLTLLSSVSGHNRILAPCTKRKADLASVLEHSSESIKKCKKDVMNEDTDVIIGGMSSAPDISLAGDSEGVLDTVSIDDSDTEREFLNVISEIWASDLCSRSVTSPEDAEIYFHSKLLDAIRIYLRTMQNVLDGTFDFFMNLLSKPLALAADLQCSLLSLLSEYIGWSPSSRVPIRTPPLMYKHLQPFVTLLILSPVNDMKDLAYNLARAAMLSTGAFDRNLNEVGAWFLFLSGYGRNESHCQVQGLEVAQSFSTVVVQFLCDAISTVGNNLFKYWDIVRHHAACLKGFKGVLPEFSPLVVCALHKCLRLLGSESKSYSLPEKTMISMYVCNTLKYLLQTQVDAGLLSSLIESVLSEGVEDRGSALDGSEDSFSAWRPLKTLLVFSQSVLHQKACSHLSADRKSIPIDSSFANTLAEVKELVRNAHGSITAGIIKSFSSAMLCTTPDMILKNFPLVITISQTLLGAPVSLLSLIIPLQQNFLASLSKSWPEMFSVGLEMALSMIHHEGKEDDACGIPEGSLFAEENIDFYATQSAASAFCCFLKQAPFHVVFPAIISPDILCLLEPSKIKNILLVKISECKSDCLISYLRLVLFWFYQIRSSYTIQPLTELKHLSEICLTIVKHLFTQLSVSKPDSYCSVNDVLLLSAESMQEAACTIFCHPMVVASLYSPLSCNEEFTLGNFEITLEKFLILCRQSIHEIDHHVLDLLTTTCDYVLSHHQDSQSKVEDGANEPLMKSLNDLVKALLLHLRNKFDLCAETEYLMPLLAAFYAIHSLIQFISPFDLLELVRWVFNRFGGNNFTGENSCKISALSVGFCIAAGAFDVLSMYLHQPVSKRALYDIFWETEKHDFDGDLFGEIYVKVCKFAANAELHFANICLLRAVNAVYRQKFLRHHNLHPLSLVMHRVILKTPVETVSRCIYRTSMLRAKCLFFIAEMSPLHLLVFGHLFLSILDESSPIKGSVMEETCGSALTDEEFMMLLPVALLYVKSVLVKFEKTYYEHLIKITSFYSRMLLNGFLHWRNFVSQSIFVEEYDEFHISSTEELLKFADGSLLVKAILMLQLHFTLSGDSIKMKRRVKLFNSIFSCSAAHDDLLDCDVNEMDFGSLNNLLNVVNRVVAKVLFSRMLLFPEDSQIQCLSNESDKDVKEISSEVGSTREDLSRMRFMSILVDTWQCVVKKLASISDGSTKGKSTDYLCLYNCLQDFILRCILELAKKMRSCLVQLQSLPFLEHFMRCSLLYRFEDPTTLEVLRNILSLMAEGKLSRVPYLQLLLAHSQFAPSIRSISKASGSHTGAFCKPMSTILRSRTTPHSDPKAVSDKNNQEASKLNAKQLEIIKLLRVLLQTKHNQCCFGSGKDIGINLRELYLLLLSSYGATLSEIDLEIYKVMHEIELIDESDAASIAEIDYLWGNAALKIRKERAFGQDRSSVVIDSEVVEEHRRSQFRENLQVDPGICAATVLWFPYNRTATDESLSLNKLQPENLKDIAERNSLDVQNIQRYDPAFILRFSIHSLSLGYLEPVEFAGLGLLAVAFASMSSSDVGMRKLGYETLGRFKNALKKFQKNKDVMRLQLLLTYVQNGIEEPWQRIPSVIALFAAETSLILLDPSHDHYTTLSKLLMHSSRVNLKGIPFFNNFFCSSSLNFKKERRWILHLAYAGLNTDDDAQIYIRNSIFEMLLSFYSSPLADNESKELILQIVKKSVKLHKMARYLVDCCGLLSWLSSVLSMIHGMLLGNGKYFPLTQLILVTEVVNDVLSSRSIVEWLQRYALEQLTEISLHLYRLLVGGLTLIKENVALVDSIFQIMLSTLKISQKRKIFQPHLTLSLEALVQIYQAVTVHDISRCNASAELGLQVILMSMPPVDIFHMDPKVLSSFLLWATSTALMSDTRKTIRTKESCLDFTINFEEAPHEESLLLKFLRWLIASIILGKFSCKVDLNSKFSRRSNSESLQSLLQYVERGCQESGRSDSEELLAAEIYYLQQLLGINCRVLPSVVSALALLLLCDASRFAGSDFMAAHGTSIASLLSKIQYPPEANPSWRWSFYQPWKDLSSEQQIDLQKIDELHACQTLLLIFSNMIGKKSLDSITLSYQDLEFSGVFKWERSLVQTE